MKSVFTNGCFDVLHRGHFELLKYCKSLGTVTVGLNSDKSVRRLKGSTRPFFNQDDRLFALLSCRYVDAVVIFDEDTPYNLIKQTKPDIIVKGGDYKKEALPEYNIIQSYGGKIIIEPFIDGFSTTNIIKRMNNDN